MSSRGAARAADAAAPPAARGTAFDAVVDFGREQFAVGLEMSAAMWRGFEAIRAIQQHAAQTAGVRHRTAARELRAATQPEQLALIPATLWQRDCESALHAWQEFSAALLDAQIEALQSACCVDAQAALEAAAAVDALDATARSATPVGSGGRRATRRH